MKRILQVWAFCFLCFSFLDATGQTLNLLSTPSPLSINITFPNIQTWRHAKGARVYFVPRPELPMVDIRLVFDAGAARDILPGVAALTNSMLNQGTSRLSAIEIAEAFEQEGAQFQLSSFRDMALLGLRSLSESKHLWKSIELLQHILTDSIFPPADFERTRNQLLVAIAEGEESPLYQLERSFYQTLYHGHPYAQMPLGDKNIIKTIKREDILTFYKTHYVSTNLTIALVGALSRHQAETIVDKLLQHLPSGTKPTPLPPVPFPTQKTNVMIPFTSTQTHVMLGLPTVTRTNPDYFALSIANHILGGGGLVSVLHQALREKKGLTYTVDSMVIPMHQAGPFSVRFQSRNNEAKQAIQTVLEELQKFIATGPTEEQLLLAKNQLIGSLPFSMASNEALVEQLAMMGFYELKPDYLTQYYQAILNSHSKQVKEIFQKYVSLDTLALITVGNHTTH